MIKKEVAICLIVFLIVLLVLIINSFGNTGFASLTVNSKPSMEVFIDGKDVGKSPYVSMYPPGQVVLKLGSFETVLDLHSGIKTIVDRDFGNDGMTTSSGEILSFEINRGATLGSVAFVSEPIGASVFLDDDFKGNTPLQVDNLASQIYKVTFKASGYSDRSFKIQTVDHYKLTADVDLARVVSSEASSPSPFAVNVKQMVEILSTPNGFLRVRSGPATSSSEVGEVHPGESYPLLSIDKESGWFEINFTANSTSSGWISNTYAVVKPN